MCVEAKACACHFHVVAFCILQGWIQFYYLKGAIRNFLLCLIAQSSLFDCQSCCCFFSLSPQERVFLTISNYIFTAIFVGEMTLKVTFYNLLLLQTLLLPVTPECSVCTNYRDTSFLSVSSHVFLLVSLTELSLPQCSQSPAPSLLSWQFPCSFQRIEQLSNVIN